MKKFKKILKIIGCLLLLLVIGGAIHLYNSGPILPLDTAIIIEKAIKEPLPEIIHGQQGFVSSQGIKIWYESQMPLDSSKGTILLIMGISNDALGWPSTFLKDLVGAGYQVIRYDHRGTGMSDWMKDWDSEEPYSLADMAKDGIAILDQLDIEKAHILGVSMGGMIAQEMVINHPNRANSLISIMSSGDIFDTELPPISGATAIDLITVAAKYGIVGGEANLIKMHIASRIILMGTAQETLDIQEISTNVLYNIRNRRGYNANVSQQHQGAVSNSKSRYTALQKLTMPALIIHGKADPFIPFEHGQKMISLIPHADSLWLDNMGHDIPESLMDTIMDKIISYLEI